MLGFYYFYVYGTVTSNTFFQRFISQDAFHFQTPTLYHKTLPTPQVQRQPYLPHWWSRAARWHRGVWQQQEIKAGDTWGTAAEDAFTEELNPIVFAEVRANVYLLHRRPDETR